MPSGKEKIAALINGSVCYCLDQINSQQSIKVVIRAHEHPSLPEGLLSAGERRVSLFKGCGLWWMVILQWMAIPKSLWVLVLNRPNVVTF